MKKFLKVWLPLILAAAVAIGYFLYIGGPRTVFEQLNRQETEITEEGIYTSKKDVAEYIHLFGKLPQNYITKEEAEALGWVSTEYNLDKVAPGKSLGGTHFGNYEGILPEGNYLECDVNYNGGIRNSERLIYSDDGRIYYTNDHYRHFEQLY